MATPAQTQADIDPRLLQAPEAATQRASFSQCSTFSPIPHCFACPPSCSGPSLLSDGHSPRPATSNAHPLDFFVAYNMAAQSPFAQLKATVEDPSKLLTSLEAGRCTSPDTVFPSSHVEQVMLPRVQALIDNHRTLLDQASCPGSPASSASTAGDADKRAAPDTPFAENQQVDELMHVIQLHTSNIFSMKEFAVPLADELRTLLRITASGAPALGSAPDASARPKQFFCACLIRANLLFLLADHLFRAYASLDPETGFGLPNAPTTGTADAAAVREAEGLLRESLQLHDAAADALSGGVAEPGTTGAVRSGSSPPPPSSISEADDDLRSVRHVQPRSKVMLRYALVQAALGKRQQAVETLVKIAQMDPWLPELELRPPAVAHAHRISVEQAKVGLVWYFNSCHDAIRANKYHDDAVFWRIRRLNQEAATWEPADLLPGRAGPGRAPAAALDPPEARGGREARPAPSLRSPAPRADSQCGSATAEEHVAKLVLEAREADDKDLAIGILGRAVEHAAASAAPHSPIIAEPLIEYCYHIVCAPSPATSTSFTTAVHLLLYALRTLRDPGTTPADSESAGPTRRLQLRTRALHTLAVALHQTNRVRDPLLMHRRALALVLRASGDEASMWTLEPRVHIVVLAIVRLFMLSHAGQQHLNAAADRSDCPEGTWKTTYGRGRPGRARRFFQPVVHRDNGVEARQVSGWLRQQLQAGIRILAKHLLGLATAAVEKLRNPPAPTPVPVPSVCGVSPLCSTASGVCPSTLRSIEETASMHSQWGADTSDLNVDSVATDVAAGDTPVDDGLLDTAEPPGAAAARLQRGRSIFRCVSQKARTQLVDRNSAAATAAVAASVSESSHADVPCSELVDCLERTCEEASSLAKEAQTSGFAVRMPPWISRLCIPHWSIALMLLSHLDISYSEDAAAAAELADLTASLRCVLDIFFEFFPAAGGAAADEAAFGDDATDAVLSYVLHSTSSSAVSSGSGDGAAAAPAAGASPLATVQTTPAAPHAAHVCHSAPVLPASTFDNGSGPKPADPDAALLVSLEHFPVNDCSAFEDAQFERIMSDVVDVGPQQGFTVEQLPECYRCFLDLPALHQHPADSLSLAGSATFTEPPPEPSPRVITAASPSLSRLRPSPLSVPSPTCTPPASQLMLPSAAPFLSDNLPKPSVESFGLEADEVTAISLGPTPIPSLLAMCRGPSRRTTPGPTADMRIESSTDDSSHGSSSSHPPTPSGDDATSDDASSNAAVPSPFAGTALFVASHAGDSGCGDSPASDVPPASPSPPPPPCRSPEPLSARSPVDDVGIPFSTLFAPPPPSESTSARGRDAPAPADSDRSSCCSIFGSGGTARLVTQQPRAAEPLSCRAGLWGAGGHSVCHSAGPSVITAHSSWHTPAYERGSVMLSEEALSGDGSGTLSDDAESCVTGTCPAASACCCVKLMCSAGGGTHTAGAERDASGHRRTVSVPAMSLNVSSRQLSMTPDMRSGHGPDSDSVSLVPQEPTSSGGRGAAGEPLDTMPCSLAPRSAEASWGGGLWGREGPSGMASRRARSICLDNLNL
eukprot:jgi/Ulvmu1/3981/UM182_0009.1